MIKKCIYRVVVAISLIKVIEMIVWKLIVR